MVHFFKKDNKKSQRVPRDFAQELKALETKLENVSKELEEVKETAQKAITRVGVVRYNPFHDMGGDQSFSIALLDESANGLVVTSYYGRDGNRMYAKPIQGGKSEHQLSKEEQEAISQAIGLENPKHEIRNPKRV